MINTENKLIKNEALTAEVEKLFAETFDFVQTNFNDTQTKFEEAKEKAITALGINPRQAAEYEVKHSVEAQLNFALWKTVKTIAQIVRELPNIDNFTRIILFQERIDKHIESEQNRLTDHFNFPSSSSQLSCFLEGMEMQTRFKFYFDGWGLRELVHKIRRGLENIQKLAVEQNEPMPKANLAERISRETKYNEGENVEITVKPNYGHSVKIVVTDNPLTRTIYIFNVNNATCELALNEYSIESKESARHRNYDYKTFWGEGRSNNRMERTEVQIPLSICTYARQAASMITGIKPEVVS